MNAEWVGVIVSCVILAISVGTILWRLSAVIKSFDDHKFFMTKQLQDVKDIIGNGHPGGIRDDIKEIKLRCAAHVAQIDERTEQLETAVAVLGKRRAR